MLISNGLIALFGKLQLQNNTALFTYPISLTELYNIQTASKRVDDTFWTPLNNKSPMPYNVTLESCSICFQTELQMYGYILILGS